MFEEDPVATKQPGPFLIPDIWAASLMVRHLICIQEIMGSTPMRVQ